MDKVWKWLSAEVGGTVCFQGSNKAKSLASATRFLQSKSLTCIALCEGRKWFLCGVGMLLFEALQGWCVFLTGFSVITSKDLKKSNNIWVMPNPDHVCTPLLLCVGIATNAPFSFGWSGLSGWWAVAMVTCLLSVCWWHLAFLCSWKLLPILHVSTGFYCVWFS